MLLQLKELQTIKAFSRERTQRIMNKSNTVTTDCFVIAQLDMDRKDVLFIPNQITFPNRLRKKERRKLPDRT